MHTPRAESPSRKSEGDSVRRVVNARKSRKPDECGTSFQSSPKINRMFITRLICNTMKVYITRPVSLTIEVLLIKIVLFFDHWRNHLFQSYQRFQAIEFVDRPVPEKLEIFRLFLCMHGFRHASILSTVFIASHAGIFRGARFWWKTSCPKNACVGGYSFHGVR